MLKNLFILFLDKLSITLIPCFIIFFPFLVFISFFFLSLFTLIFLASYIDLVSLGSDISSHFYDTIGGSDLPLTGDKGFGPVTEEINSILPCSREGCSEISPASGSSEHKPYIDRRPFPGEAIRFPCVEDDNS
jgi:hypothetical protein